MHDKQAVKPLSAFTLIYYFWSIVRSPNPNLTCHCEKTYLLLKANLALDEFRLAHHQKCLILIRRSF